MSLALINDAASMMSDNRETRLCVVLGDQLSLSSPSIRSFDPASDTLFMAEVMVEATYVPHHRKKVALIFSAMRHFAAEREADGWTVDYVRLDDPANTNSLISEIDRAASRNASDMIMITMPGEWRLLQAFRAWMPNCGYPVKLLEDDRFLSSQGEFERWANGRKQLRMEYFYREMRRKTGLLMQGDIPVGGHWNYDAANRKRPPQGLCPAQPLAFAPDQITQDVLNLVGQHFPDQPGRLAPFWFAVTRGQALQALEQFVEERLPQFGDFQDAMLSDQRFLFHSILSVYLNIGLLDPLEVCQRVEHAYSDGDAPLNAVEGFIRQVIGWREFVRGIYWLQGQSYGTKNFFDHQHPLPDFYWTGETDMACLSACIGQTLDEAYAHHIQRLMVTGNFAMLAGIHPFAIHEWYLAVYADAFEWVELPNTLGMSQFADGGVLASKPYAASGNYINRMSDYCRQCRFDVKQRAGPNACPFNYLYWDFVSRHRERLERNPRMGNVYRTWDHMSKERKDAVSSDAQRFLANLFPTPQS